MATPWSFQLYSARNFQPWDKVLKTLGQARLHAGRRLWRRLCRPGRVRARSSTSNGLSMPSGHFSIDLLENDFDGAVKIAKTLGVKLIACPHIAADQRPTDAAGWQRLRRAARQGRRQGQAGRLRFRLAQP